MIITITLETGEKFTHDFKENEAILIDNEGFNKIKQQDRISISIYRDRIKVESNQEPTLSVYIS